jgi:hypothetical protein
MPRSKKNVQMGELREQITLLCTFFKVAGVGGWCLKSAFLNLRHQNNGKMLEEMFLFFLFLINSSELSDAASGLTLAFWNLSLRRFYIGGVQMWVSP